MAFLDKKTFGFLSGGQEADLYTLKNNAGMEITITNYGGAIVSCILPDRNGKPTDVVLGYNNASDYERNSKYLGALIGRHANRIEKGRFTLSEKEYSLYCNDGPNHLHGGKNGFDKKLWKAQPKDGILILSYISPDGEEGYPGTLTTTVTYSLSDDNRLTIDYYAQSDADTVCNLTNHSYFNLSGHESGEVLDQVICIHSESYTEADAQSLPTGKILPVSGTPLDLRQPVPIGKNIDCNFEQLRFAGGFDHNWVVNGENGTFRPAAFAYSGKTGIVLEVSTTLPGIQFYSGNYLDGAGTGKNGVPYGRRCGFCLESQYFPNALEHSNFEQPILRKNDTYHAVTTYRFGIKK